MVNQISSKVLEPCNKAIKWQRNNMESYGRFHKGQVVLLVIATSLIALSFLESVSGADDNGAPNWSPNMEILEIIPSPNNTTQNEIIKQVPKGKNSEIVVGEDVNPNSRLVIKCNATFPVQIIYIGAGRPEFTTFTNVQWREDPEKPITFEAEASLGLLGFQGALRVEDTGNYTCRSIQNSTIVAYFYIYVPGPSLFTPPDDYNSELFFTPKDKNILIPCTAAHPKAIVSLHKTAAGKLMCPAIGKNVATYDPHKGFYLNLKDSSLKTPEGTYVCVGSQNDNFRIIEYKLIASDTKRNNKTNGGSGGDNGKQGINACRCGEKAECSIIDGYPVCYCFRGFSGNPYSECREFDKDGCKSNDECPKGRFCVQGKCVQNVCQPSTCGKGATCQSQSGKPICTCQFGYDGKPPYCVRKCQFNGDCPENEICTRHHCQNPCPNRCGKNADCQVVQVAYNRTVVCTCGPGTTGHPEESCYDIGVDPSQTNSQCPVGFIGPGPPNCKRKECTDNYDCPPNKYCSAEKLCIDNFDLSSNSTTSITSISSTATVPSEDPCSPNLNPCPRNSVCKVRYRFGRIDSGGLTVDCVCPPGESGHPPNCISIQQQPPNRPSSSIPISPDKLECLDDPDCPRGHECVGRYCIPIGEKSPQCRRRCGLNAQCIHGLCTCPKKTVGDPHISCQAEQSACSPSSPCANFAECREINGKAACRCILGYEGDAFTKCLPVSSSNSNSDRGFPSSPSPGFRQNDGSQSHPSFSQGFISDNYFRPTNSRFDTTPKPNWGSLSGRNSNNRGQDLDIESCDPRNPNACGHEQECVTNRRGISKCICTSSRCGYNSIQKQPNFPEGVSFGRYCRHDRDCRYPEVCSNVTANCYDPCDSDHSPCVSVAYSECRVLEGRALCTCRRGYVGNPASGLDCRRDFGTSLENLDGAGGSQKPVVYCDHEKGIGCDSKSECKLIDGQGRCACGPGYVGTYPDCRLQCRTNRDCFNAHECWRGECIDPCDRNSCGNNAFCSVNDHHAQCKCQIGFSGNPWVICHRDANNRNRGFLFK